MSQTVPNSPYVPVNILVVDDDETSIISLQRAMKKIALANPVYIAKNGLEALEILDSHVDSSTEMPPFIVTLDLNMPKMNGHQFLETIRDHPIYHKLVVFVLTTSDAPKDIDSAYSKNIAGYIVKEDAADSLKNALQMLSDYSNLIVLPKM